jgi:hypothetical protein
MLLFGPYLPIGRPERCVEWCRAQLGRGRDTQHIDQDRPGRRADNRRFS